MNIQDAIKSGLRFQRPGKIPLCDSLEKMDQKEPHDRRKRICLTYEDILAEDWETEEKEISLTWSQIEKAHEQAFSVAKGESNNISYLRMRGILGFN